MLKTSRKNLETVLTNHGAEAVVFARRRVWEIKGLSGTKKRKFVIGQINDQSKQSNDKKAIGDVFNKE